MTKQLDPIEQEYERAISNARTDDEAYELSIGLRQYKQMYKVGTVPANHDTFACLDDNGCQCSCSVCDVQHRNDKES
jgi:hypothetical protein